MKTWQRIVITGAVLGASVALGVWATNAWRRPPEADNQPGKGPKEGDVVLETPQLDHRNADGSLAWKVLIDRMELQTGAGLVTVQGVREGIIYGPGGKPALRVTAKQVTGNSGSKDFDVTGDVTVTSPQGFVITTDRVQWLNDRQTLHCPGAVQMKTKKMVISTALLDYNLTSDVITCPNQVRMFSGNNVVVGERLNYNVKTKIVDLQNIQMVMNPEEGREILKELRGQ